ncbi:low molecular weight protein-tyrosine-phosphatase [Novosphingobium pituita]|uniref:protein-tyrosine-phosphatase n=1 Tax=Novosphingobium pituita TaxID=3056842 RepID=A0ABQ6PC41_9SPHN|nr:low molecular weight protein-tyrosine-phosphatase [Novosphingobium sp. IK01]MDK4806594.1 low molecular weight protein-tyrosine-phosphatase [Novosphingobium aromaticivorans]GMM62039.1 low molecular weight protein-tyrosine-phosphatase [Novosphingobium sp. IK01]HIQ19010.1 low molecular weight phosphotyrosine protein phosphatase [Novosphingobium capsulatum]
MSQPAVLFVCLGNICRSPMAEAAFREEAVKAGLAVTIESAGTGGWHVGNPPDPRAQAEALRHGVDISKYRARQVVEEDFVRFGQIFALDPQNLQDLKRIAPRRTLAKVGLLMDLVPGRAGTAVIDPYYGTDEDFAEAWDDVSLAAQRLVARMLR